MPSHLPHQNSELGQIIRRVGVLQGLYFFIILKLIGDMMRSFEDLCGRYAIVHCCDTAGFEDAKPTAWTWKIIFNQPEGVQLDPPWLLLFSDIEGNLDLDNETTMQSQPFVPKPSTRKKGRTRLATRCGFLATVP